jgi:hypothetical protein
MKKLLSLFSLLLALPAFGQVAIPVTNAGTTGTTLNSTAIINSSNNAVIAGTGNTAVPTYIVTGGAGTTSQALLAVLGPASCTMDSTIASGAAWYYVLNSTTTGGDCHAQSAAPSAGTWVIGYLASVATTSGSTAQVIVSPYVYGGAAGGLPSIAAHTVVGNNTGSSATAAQALLGAQDVSPNTYVTAAGSVNVLTAALSPAVTSYVAGLQVLILPNLANTTTTPTINLNSLGAKTITKYGTTVLAAGDLSTTAVAVLIYDGTEFQLVNPQTATSGLPSIAAHTFLGNNSGSTATAAADSIGAQDSGPGRYASGAGSVNVLTATLSPAVTSYTSGLEVLVLPNLANTTTTPTINLNGLGAKNITRFGTNVLSAGDLSTTALADLIYDGTEFQLMNPQTATGGLPSIAAHTFLGNPGASSATAAATAIGPQDSGPPRYAAAAGSVNALTATMVPAVTSYVTGLEVVILPNLANTTTTPTVNLNSLGAVTITKLGTSPLAAGDISTTALADLIYDGTEFQLMNPQTSNTTGGANGMTAWGAGSGTEPALPASSNGWMAPPSGGTSCVGQLPATITAGFARYATPGTVQGVCASQLSSALINLNDLTGIYAAGGGSANAQTVTVTPAATSLVAGLHVQWLPTAANTTTTPTLAVSGLTAKTITKCGTSALAASDLTTTAIASATYDGTEWQLGNPQAAGCGSSGSGTPGGSNTQVQYDNGGVFGGISVFTYDGTNLADTAPSTAIGNTIVVTTGPSALAALTSTITAVATSIPFSTTGYATATANSPVALLITGSAANDELVLCTASTGSSMTCARGVGGSTATAWTSAAHVWEVEFAVEGKSGSMWPVIQLWNGPTYIGMSSALVYNDASLFGTSGIYTGANGITTGVVTFNNNANATIGEANSGSGYGINFNGSTFFVDGQGATANYSAVTAQTLASGTTSLTPSAGVWILGGAAPTSGGLLTIVPASTMAACSVSGNMSCSIKFINTIASSITTGSGTAANDFAAAYTLAAKGSMTCTAYGSTVLWYCD